MARGEVSAARTRISAVPRLRVLVAVSHHISLTAQVKINKSKTWLQNGNTFVCAFLELAIVGRLLDEIKDVLGQSLVGNRPSYVDVSNWNLERYSVGKQLPALCSPDMFQIELRVPRNKCGLR